MITPSLGDQARLLSLTRMSGALRHDITARMQELSSGQRADLSIALGGDHGRLARIDSAHSTADAYLQVARGMTLSLEVAQSAVAALGDGLGRLRNTLHLAVQTGTAATLDQVTAEADSAFRDAVASLNTAPAGRSLFAGMRSDGPALAPADTMLTALRNAIAAAPAPQDAVAMIEAWFAPGGGFDSIGYLGGPAAGVPLRLGDGARMAPPPTAADPGMRTTLAALAVAALSADTPGGQTAQRQMLGHAAAGATGAGDALVQIAAGIGRSQALVDRAESAAQAQIAALDRARIALTAADPFETAVRLEDTMRRLEALFSVTARSARMTLTGYL